MLLPVQVKVRAQPLNCITKKLIDSGQQLQEITDKKVECLKAFVNNKKFADWLKKSLRGLVNVLLGEKLVVCNLNVKLW